MRSVRWFGVFGVILSGSASLGCPFSPEPFFDQTGGNGQTGGHSAGGGGASSSTNQGGSTTTSVTITDTAISCLKTEDCNDDKPCTADECVDDHCVHFWSDDIVPNDNEVCTADSCKDGVEHHTPIADDTPCGTTPPTTHCEAGKCIGCTKDEHCGPTSECATPKCNTTRNTCDVEYGETSLLEAAQIESDCKVKKCDAMHKVIEVVDQNDPPPSDTNVCTIEGCSAEGIPTLSIDVGAPCGAGPTCGGSPLKQKTQDTCDVSGSCATGTDSVCGNYKCNATNTACSTSCMNDGSCAGGSYCDMGSHVCIAKKLIGVLCGGPNECNSGYCVDGVCCNGACASDCQACNVASVAGTCSAIPKGLKDDCGAGKLCNTGSCSTTNKSAIGEVCADSVGCYNGNCAGGVCRIPIATACLGPLDMSVLNSKCEKNLCKNGLCATCFLNSDCPVTSTCNTAEGRCLLPNNSPCGGSTDCLSNNCVDLNTIDAIPGTCQPSP